jgi:hypothetical protein
MARYIKPYVLVSTPRSVLSLCRFGHVRAFLCDAVMDAMIEADAHPWFLHAGLLRLIA